VRPWRPLPGLVLNSDWVVVLGWNLGSVGIESELIFEELLVDWVQSDCKLRKDLLSIISELSQSPATLLGGASLRAVANADAELVPVNVFITLWLLVLIELWIGRMRKPWAEFVSMIEGLSCLTDYSVSWLP